MFHFKRNEKWTIERDWNHSLILNTFQFTINSIIFKIISRKELTVKLLHNYFTYLMKFHLARMNEGSLL